MTDTLVLFGYGSAMVLGFAAVATILYYSFSRSNRYEIVSRPKVEVPEVEEEN